MNLKLNLFVNLAKLITINIIYAIICTLVIFDMSGYFNIQDFGKYVLLLILTMFMIWSNLCTLADIFIDIYLKAKELEKEFEKK